MERTIQNTMTPGLEAMFRDHIEGMVPDLVGCADGDEWRDPNEEDFESVLDYALDNSFDLMPYVPDEERRAMCVRVAKYFTGGGE